MYAVYVLCSLLALAFNRVSDISVLEFITQRDYSSDLQFFRLNNNRVSDLSPCRAILNAGGSTYGGPAVDVRHNRLSDESLEEHIPALRDRYDELN